MDSFKTRFIKHYKDPKEIEKKKLGKNETVLPVA